MKQSILFFLLALLIAGNSAIASVYKWVDENGQVHFGDAPQATQTTKEINLPKAHKPDPHTLKRLEAQKKYLNARQEERAAENEAKAKAAEENASREKSCASYKKELNTLQNGGRLYAKLPDGERHYISDSERESAIAFAKNGVQTYCK